PAGIADTSIDTVGGPAQVKPAYGPNGRRQKPIVVPGSTVKNPLPSTPAEEPLACGSVSLVARMQPAEVPTMKLSLMGFGPFVSPRFVASMSRTVFPGPAAGTPLASVGEALS